MPALTAAAGRPQGRRPDRARQHARVLRRRARRRRRHDRVRRPARARRRHGELVLAHDYERRTARDAPTLEEGLAHLAVRRRSRASSSTSTSSCRATRTACVDALREHGLVERSLVSSQYLRSLDRVRALDPAHARSAGRCRAPRRDYTTTPLAGAGSPCAALLVYRRLLPRRAVGPARAAGSTPSWPTGASSRRGWSTRCVRRAADLYVWTVDDAARIGASGARRDRRHHERPPPVFRPRRLTRRSAWAPPASSGPPPPISQLPVVAVVASPLLHRTRTTPRRDEAVAGAGPLIGEGVARLDVLAVAAGAIPAGVACPRPVCQPPSALEYALDQRCPPTSCRARVPGTYAPTPIRRARRRRSR